MVRHTVTLPGPVSAGNACREPSRCDERRLWSVVACHRFGRAEQVPPPSHLFSQATAIGEDESGGKPPHSKIAFR